MKSMKKVLVIGSLFYLIACASSPHKSSVKIYLEQRNPDKAVVEGEKWVADEPQNPEAHLWLGVAYVSAKEYVKAANEFIKGFELDSTYLNPDKLGKTFSVGGVKLFTVDGVATTFQNAGSISNREGNLDAALTYLNYAKRFNPSAVQTYLLLSAVYQKLGKNEEAMKILEEGAAKVGNSKELYYYLAVMQASNKEYDKALENLKKALEVDSTFGKAYYETGVIYYEQGDNEKAMKYLKKATTLDPENADAWFSLGIVALKISKFREAEAAFRKYTELKPDDPQGWFYLGAVLYEAGKYQEALAALDKSDQLNPGDPDVYNYKGLVYKKMGQTQKALEMFKKASELEKGKE